MKQGQFFFSLLFIVFLMACSTSKQNQEATKSENNNMISKVLPNILIYKTKQDYSQNVPVLMNVDKTSILSYPAPSDLCRDERCTYPTLLNDGFLLDNRGINKNVVFLSYTYDEYGAMLTAPPVKELMEHIIDKNPLTELYNCGKAVDFKNLVEELNVLIDTKRYKEKPNLVQ